MSCIRPVVGSLFLALSTTVCSEVGVNECMEEAVSARMAAAQATTDWRDQLDSIVAVTPADSVLGIIVFVAVTARADFKSWANERGVPITYEFLGFSAYSVSPAVADLPSLKDVLGVTGIDWGVGSIGPLCHSLGPE